ncbi:PREDICTED: tripartite motif-containing protein 15-like, partial [Buceros rhinoceros silvestris]|uniref:tripartite motif-containing protein 15-like n=1 Tax=Buceros rhinoceros silvestris TaxID=175836 RepID=UPI0005292B22
RRTQAEKQKIVTQYQELHKVLEHQEASTVAQLEQLDVEVATTRKKILDGLSEETTRLNTLIKELERLGQQPDWEVLKDIKTTLSRCQQKPISQPPDVSLELEEKFKALAVKTTVEAMQTVRDAVEFHLSLRAQVTLDPRTAHAELLIADDRRSMRWVTTAQHLPSAPERFRSCPCVLGSRGFSSGRHCWEVEATGQGMWAVGVAKESVPRDRSFLMMIKEGMFKALNLLKVPQRLRVVLDLQERRVVFFDANTKKRIYTFWKASFNGETIYPWFMVEGDVRLQLC